MSKFEIFTDSSANLPKGIIKKYHIGVAPFICIYGGKEHYCTESASDFNSNEFYAAMRAKQPVTTSMVNEHVFYNMFKDCAEKGKKLLYVGMSSALSVTYSAACRALNELRDEFPHFEYHATDTLSGSLGEGLICYYSALMREKGDDLNITVKKLNYIVERLRSRFTPEDLFYIKRGGRISATAAIAGSLLGIKPLLKTQSDGVIVMQGKVRGRKAALDKLIDELKRSVDMAKHQIVAISHADCSADAEYLKSELKKLPYVSDILLEPMEPVTACHGGPGMIALFYIAREKNA